MASTASAVLALKGLSTPCCNRLPSSLRPFYNFSIATSAFLPTKAKASGKDRHFYDQRDYCSFKSSSLWNGAAAAARARIKDSCELADSNFPRAFDGRQFHNQRRAIAIVAASASATPAAETVVSESSSAAANNASAGASQASDIVERPLWRANIDFKWIRENKDAIAENIVHRKAGGDVEAVVQLYEQFVQLSQEVDKLRAERNSVANAMKGKLEKARRDELISQGKNLKDQLAGLEQQLDLLSDKLQREGQRIPNMTHPSVPLGSEELATVRKMVGGQRQFSFPLKDHVELGLALDLFDFEAAAEVSGNKFYYLKNEGVLLEMALINWTLAELLKRGFVLLSTPDLARSIVVEKCGFQPRGLNTQVYSIEGTDLCLAGTSEILVGGLYMDSMLPEVSLPLRLVAFSHCFRTEAGAAGSATRTWCAEDYIEFTSSAR